MAEKTPKVLIILPMAFQDGIDKLSGIMRFLNGRKVKWDIRLDRLSKSNDALETYRLSDFDGMIVDDLPSDRLAAAFLRLSKPLVALDWRDTSAFRKRHRSALIEADSKAIGKLAAQTLLDVEHYASYAYLPRISGAKWSDARGKAFCQGLAKRKIAVTTLEPRQSLSAQVRRLPKPTAVFATTDIAAANFIRQANAAGILIPQDVSVLGVDNERLTCLYTNPPLASIQPDFEEAGYLAAESLHKLMNGDKAPKRRHYHVKDVVRRKSMDVSGTSGRLAERIKELIRNTPVAEFGNISDLADQLEISRRLLDKVFRQIEGRTVLDAIQERRMDEVCHLLVRTSIPILEICETCFPGSGTYPLRLFRKRFGMTMYAYRKGATEPSRSSAPPTAPKRSPSRSGSTC